MASHWEASFFEVQGSEFRVLGFEFLVPSSSVKAQNSDSAVGPPRRSVAADVTKSKHLRAIQGRTARSQALVSRSCFA